MPQGETATVSFAFKDASTGGPLVLAGPDWKHTINIVVKDTISNKGTAMNFGTITLENDGSDGEWRIFDSDEIIVKEKTTGSFTDLTDNDFIVPGSGTAKLNTLFKFVWENTNTSVYAYIIENKDKTGQEIKYYDFSNSSITVTFNRNDTKDLTPKTYYMEIYHAMSNGEEFIKHTLLPPTDFIIKGALA